MMYNFKEIKDKYKYKLDHFSLTINNIMASITKFIGELLKINQEYEKMG